MDRVLIHRVVVIDVELHHRDDGFEFGHKGAQYTQFVHPPQRAFGVAVFQQQIHEQALGVLVVAHLVVDQIEVRRNRAHRVGMDQHPRAQGLFEQAQDVQLVLKELGVILDRQTVMDDLIKRLGLATTAKEPKDRRFFFDMHRLQRGQENPRQIAHMCGVVKIVLHEMFNRTAPAVIGVSHAAGDLDLHVKGQLIHRATGNQVQMTAHRPDKVLGVVELAVFVRREHAQIDKRLWVVHVMHIFRDPEQGLQIA